MCSVHNQWYDISCATLYLLLVLNKAQQLLMRGLLFEKVLLRNHNHLQTVCEGMHNKCSQTICPEKKVDF